MGVGGGIAAYKALEVTSRLVQRNVDVRVVMTANAARFVGPLSFESLSLAQGPTSGISNFLFMA